MSDVKLPPSGYRRREEMAKRIDALAEKAEILSENSEIYKVDPAKLKEDPEILKHLNFNNNTFEISDPVKGYVYYWERDDHRMITYRKQQARALLGAGHSGWEVVNREMPEAMELQHVDGSRKIGDVVLMRIKEDSYIMIQKRLALMNKFKEASISGPLADFVRANEGLVQVHTFQNETPKQYFDKQGIPLQHTQSLVPDEIK